jgi:hypothetical protein
MEKKDNCNVSSYRLASELSFLAKIDFRSGDGSIQILLQESNKNLFKCMNMISVGDNRQIANNV